MCILTSCGHKSSDNENIEKINNTAICLTYSDEDSLKKYERIGVPRYIILEEDESSLIAEIGKILIYNDTIYILDRVGSRSIASYDMNGMPIRTYGVRGKGFGKYKFPWDMDVDDNKVYVLDRNRSKLISYLRNGQAEREVNLPFRADGFSLIGNSEFIFSIDPSEKLEYLLCITDSLIKNRRFLLKRSEDFVGGWLTANVLRKDKSGISYYQSPTDYIYNIFHDGEITSAVRIDFGSSSIPDPIKNDFSKAYSTDILKDKHFFLDNPIRLNDSTFLGRVVGGDNNSVIFREIGEEYKENSVIKNVGLLEILHPIGKDDNGNIIGYYTPEDLELQYDFDNVPDSIVQSLKDGKKVVALYRL